MQIFNNRYLVFITLISISFQLIGCSSTYLVTPAESPKTDYTYSEITEELSGKTVRIILFDSRELYGYNFRIENDTAKWIDKKSNIKNTVHIKEVETVVAKNHFLGALEGFGFGALCGLTFGMMIWYLEYLSEPSHCTKDCWFAGIGYYAPYFFTPIGGLVGSFPGLIFAHRYYYEFKHDQKNKKPIENEKQVR